MKTSKKGFTLIEVILVLAIAALIILMVLLTLPAVQRAQRDTARKDDVGKIISAFTEYMSNNRGAAPQVSSGDPGANAQGWCGGALEATTDCDLDPYIELTQGQFYAVGTAPAPAAVAAFSVPQATQDLIVITRGAQCDPNGLTSGRIIPADSTRKVAAVVRLEGNGSGGTEVYYCNEG